MKRQIALLILAISLALAGCGKDEFIIAKDGKARAAIALPDNPTSAEKRAAAELKEHLDLMSGADFKIVPASSLEKDARAIHVGNTPQAKAALGSFNSKTAPYDSIRIKSDANALYINGHERHGAYYAACEFLEETLGVRWWTPDETYLPKSPDIKIGAIDLSYAPKFEMRRSGYIKSLRTVWRPRMRSSVFATPKDAVSEELSDSYVVGCHSYYKILPPEKYFEKHPEWYSWDAKKKARFHDRGQLCRSNPEMAEEFAKNVLQKLRKNPNKKYVHVSQNDWGGDCQCEKCEALRKKFGGGESGINIWFANKIAAKIYEEFPGARVVTFAYHQTRRPPENIKPADNVFVELCSIECDFAHTLESDTEFGFTADLKKWSAITNNLFIWNYVTCFWNYAIPHPNMGGLDADLRFFAANGGRGIYEQGDSQCNVGNFCDLRNWLVHKLMWKPHLDAKKLTREFLDGYYGKEVGALLGRYLEIINGSAARTNYAQHCFFMDTLTWLDVRGFDECLGLMKRALSEAERLAKENPEKYASLPEKVERVKISIDLAAATSWLEIRELSARENFKPKNLPDPVEAIERFDALTKKLGTKTMRENATRKMFAAHKKRMLEMAKLQKLYAANPPKKGSRAEEYKKVFGEMPFVEYNEVFFDQRDDDREFRILPVQCELVPDALASNGYAAAAETGCENRRVLAVPLRFDLAKLYEKSGKKTADAEFAVYAFIRLRSPIRKSAYITLWLENKSAKSQFAFNRDLPKEVSQKDYALVKLGTVKVSGIDKNKKSLSTYSCNLRLRNFDRGDALLIDSLAVGIK